MAPGGTTATHQIIAAGNYLNSAEGKVCRQRHCADYDMRIGVFQFGREILMRVLISSQTGIRRVSFGMDAGGAQVVNAVR
jgi:hypothetical protein